MSTPNKCPHCGADYSVMLSLEGSRTAHAATKRELEAMREQYESLARRSAESRSTLCRLRVERDQAESRVRELEKWKLAAKALWREVMAEDADGQIEDALHGINELLEAERKTLGEAIPRKD